VLSIAEFRGKITYFEHLLKQKRISFLEQLPFVQNWSIEKIKHFNSAVSEVQLEEKQLLYTIGSQSNCFYIVKSGRIAVEAVLEIDFTNKHPNSDTSWEINTKKRQY
jgi:hypothetical protein